MTLTKILSPLVGFTIAVSGIAQAGIYYDDGAQCIRVIDFPKNTPCTLQRLLYMDSLYGWNKMTYDEATDTYTLTADLWIGLNDGSDTYFEIGSEQHPRETLIMRGNLVVYPYWIEAENREQRYWTAPQAVNRLTIGMPGDESVTAALKFEEQGQAGQTLFLGRFTTPDGKLRQGHGGQLHVHHGTITSATPEPGREFGGKSAVGGMILCGDSVVLDHATLSRISGAATYGMGHNGKVAHTLFDRVGTAIINGEHDLVGCTFRNCRVAIRDYGSLDAVLTDCVFQNNEHNWTLTFSNKGLVCIDCTYDRPRKGDVYRCWKNARTGQMQYPIFTSKRHVIVEVVDQTGKPLQTATVEVRCEQQTPEVSLNTTQETDENGRTPGKGDDRAILLVETVKQATDVPNQPKVTEFTYSIEAQAKGFAPGKLQNFRPNESWQIVRILLKR